MAGYVRQSTAEIQPTLTILSSSINKEYNQLELAFGTSGHTHDGTAGNGPKIDLSTSTTGVLPVSRGGTGDPSLIGNIQNSIDNKLDKSGGHVTGNIYKTIDFSSNQVDLLFGVVLEDGLDEVGKSYAAVINKIPSGSSHNTVIGSSGLVYNPYQLPNKGEYGIPVYGPSLRLHVGDPSQPTDAVNLSTLNSQLNLRVVTPNTTTLPEDEREYVLTNTRSGSSYSPSFSPVSTPSNAPLPNSIAAYGPSGTLRVNDANDNWDAINLGQADIRYATAAQGGKADTAVSYAPQTLTEAQKGQARDNIGALDVAAISGAEEKNSPADGDFFAGIEAGVSTMFKTTWANIKAALSSVFLPLTGGTLMGSIDATQFRPTGAAGTHNYLTGGTGDGASYSTYNMSIRSHWGLGMVTYNGEVNGYYDSRTGTWDVKGGYLVNGKPVAIGDWITHVGLVSDNPTMPYMRRRSDNSIVQLAPLSWAQDQLNWRVTDTRYSGYIEHNFDLDKTIWPTEVPGGNGYVVTGIWTWPSKNLGVSFRQPQIHIPNVGWRALGSW